MSDLDARLTQAVSRRDQVAKDVQRLQGKQEAAKANLTAVEDECRSKGVEPENIAVTITTLEDRYREKVENLERDVAAAEAALAPFTKES